VGNREALEQKQKELSIFSKAKSAASSAKAATRPATGAVAATGAVPTTGAVAATRAVAATGAVPTTGAVAATGAVAVTITAVAATTGMVKTIAIGVWLGWWTIPCAVVLGATTGKAGSRVGNADIVTAVPSVQ
jgi:hypothetical protein